MQLETSANALEARANRIGRALTQIAVLAGMPASTLYRMKHHGSPRLETLRKVNAALVAEELALRDYLNALHPPGHDAGGQALAEPLAARRTPAQLEVAE